MYYLQFTPSTSDISSEKKPLEFATRDEIDKYLYNLYHGSLFNIQLLTHKERLLDMVDRDGAAAFGDVFIIRNTC